MSQHRLNGRMKKGQPVLFLGVFFGVLIGFQNCSKVAVEDTSMASLAAGTAGENAGEVVDSGDVSNIIDGSGTTVTTGNTGSQADGSTSDSSSTSTSGSSSSSSHDSSSTTTSPGSGDNVGSSTSSTVSGSTSSSDSNSNSDDSDSDGSDVSVPVCKQVRELGVDLKNNKMQSVKCLRNSHQSCVVICHRPARKDKVAISKLVRSEEAIKAHLAHGDTLGFCSKDQDQPVCESSEIEKKPKKYHKEHKGRHYDDKGKSCGRSDDHEHKDRAGEDRDEDDSSN